MSRPLFFIPLQQNWLIYLRFDDLRCTIEITSTVNSEELKIRLKVFSLRIIKMVDCMPNRISSMAIAKQIVRSGTSPAANYRAACLGKSDKDFLNKLKMVEEELDETIHWLEIIAESEMIPANKLLGLQQEAHELYKIIVSSIVTTRNRLAKEV